MEHLFPNWFDYSLSGYVMRAIGGAKQSKLGFACVASNSHIWVVRRNIEVLYAMN